MFFVGINFSVDLFFENKEVLSLFNRNCDISRFEKGKWIEKIVEEVESFGTNWQFCKRSLLDGKKWVEFHEKCGKQKLI